MRGLRRTAAVSATMITAAALVIFPATSAFAAKSSFVECTTWRSADWDTAYGSCTNSRTSVNGRARLRILCVGGTGAVWIPGAWISIPNHSTRNLDPFRCTSSGVQRTDYDSQLV
jgi:hypothetical protein